MSLRLRLIGLVAVVLVISLLLGGAIACFTASRSVGVEMRSALLIGRRAVENAVDGIAASRDPHRDLEHLVAVFKGNRHLRVSLDGDPAAVANPAVETSPMGGAPAWFVRLVNVPSEIERVPVAIGGLSYAAILLETDPRNETLDSWNDFVNTLIVLVLFSGLAILSIYLFTGRALRPLYRLAAALEQIGQGNYATRIPSGLTPELTQLHESFNRMAGQLAAADTDNRRLNELMLTLQERERSEIARDLHDEVGPYLFAVNLDTANAARQLEAGRADAALDQLRFITEAVGHMQREIRGVVRRLHPTGLAEFGLRDAIGDMIRFWRRRHPDIEFRVRVAAECEGFGELIDTTIYRIVQECLSNALRHGRPTIVAIRIERADEGVAHRDRIMLEITDNGTGMSDAAGAGFGLRGMVERARAIGGTLDLSPSGDGGLTVTAILPRRREHELADAGPDEAEQ